MGKSAPSPPNYEQLALQQGQLDKETAQLMWQLNHPNEVTPYGTNTWTEDPDHPGRYIRTESLSPQGQQNFDLQQNLMTQLLQGADQYGMPALVKALGTNFTPPREAQLGWENAYAPDQRLQTESGMWEAPYIQEGLNFSGAPAMPTADDATRQRVESALYNRGAAYLDPQFQREQEGLDTKLSNQGIFTGSQAHKDAQSELDDAKTRAYADLRNQAIQQGGQEMTNQFGMGMSARQQGVGEITSQGQFANAARGQLIQELLADMNARNAGIMGQANLASAQQNASNQGTQAWLAQKAQSTTLPINVITALMSGGQVQTPQFQPFANNASWEAPQVYQAGRDQYAGQMQQYNGNQAALGQWLNFGGRLAGGYRGMPR